MGLGAAAVISRRAFEDIQGCPAPCAFCKGRHECITVFAAYEKNLTPARLPSRKSESPNSTPLPRPRRALRRRCRNRHQQARRTSLVPIKAPRRPSAWSRAFRRMKTKKQRAFVVHRMRSLYVRRPALCQNRRRSRRTRPAVPRPHSVSSTSQSFADISPPNKERSSTTSARQGMFQCLTTASGHDAAALNFAIRSKRVCAPLRSSGHPRHRIAEPNPCAVLRHRPSGHRRQKSTIRRSDTAASRA